MPPTATAEAVPGRRYLLTHELAAELRCTAQTIRTLVKRGTLPPPIAISAKKHIWDAEAVRAALAKRQRGPQDAA